MRAEKRSPDPDSMNNFRRSMNWIFWAEPPAKKDAEGVWFWTKRCTFGGAIEVLRISEFEEDQS
jgi:hypothetical protein